MLDKRKNEEKPKGHAWRPTIFLGIMSLLGLGIVALVVWTSRGMITSQFPTARLSYTNDGHYYMLNLQTGQRIEVEPHHPQYLTGIKTHVGLKTAVDLIDVNNHTPLVESPNGQWLVGWKHIRDRWEWELMLYERVEEGETYSLGVFYGVISEAPINWSYSSQSIIFSANPPSPDSEPFNMQDEEIWRMTIPTGELIRLTNNNYRDTVPSLSPDGTEVVYISTADGLHRLYAMEVATGASRLLNPDLYGYSPVWSPDGRWIAYITNQYTQHMDIWIIRPDGTGAQAVVLGPEDDRNPMWLP